MHRRTFLALTGAAAIAPLMARAAPLEYTPGLVAERLAAGETVFVDFKASWCSTCAAQSRVLDSLKAANPAYEANITFVDVDWDTYGNGDLANSLNIPRRSTLVVLRGDQELGRIVAGTAQRDIQALMDIALSASS